MTSGNKVRFSYGKKIYDIFHYVKVGILLKGSIDLISLVPGVKKEKIFNFVDVLQLKLGIDVLNDYIIKDDELLGYRIKRIVNELIEDYETKDPTLIVLFNLKISRKASIVAVAIASLLAFLMVKCDISEKDVLKYYNETAKTYKVGFA